MLLLGDVSMLILLTCSSWRRILAADDRLTQCVQLQTAEDRTGASWSWTGASSSTGRSESGWRTARTVSRTVLVLLLFCHHHCNVQSSPCMVLLRRIWDHSSMLWMRQVDTLLCSCQPSAIMYCSLQLPPLWTVMHLLTVRLSIICRVVLTSQLLFQYFFGYWQLWILIV